MALRYRELVQTHGEAKASQIGATICAMHGGVSFADFKAHIGGLDISGMSESDQKKIANLVAPDTTPTPKKDGDK